MKEQIHVQSCLGSDIEVWCLTVTQVLNFGSMMALSLSGLIVSSLSPVIDLCLKPAKVFFLLASA